MFYATSTVDLWSWNRPRIEEHENLFTGFFSDKSDSNRSQPRIHTLI